MVKQMGGCCRANSYTLYPRRVTSIKTKREGVKSGTSVAQKPSGLGFSCKCTDAGTVDLGILTNHEQSISAKPSRMNAATRQEADFIIRTYVPRPV